MRQLVCAALRKSGYNVADAWNLGTARRMITLFEPSLVILDLGLESEDGRILVDECVTAGIHVIVVSAREEVVERLACLEMGADDYMVKPIDARELMLRLKRILKTSPGAEPPAADEAQLRPMDFGSFKIHFIEHTVSRPDGTTCTLTKSEFNLLRLFINNIGTTLDRHAIARIMSGRSNFENSRAIDVLVSKLRKKLDDNGHRSAIRNVRGEGYIFDAKPLVPRNA